jgi:hypothetical protein
MIVDRATDQAVSGRLPTAAARFKAGSGYVGFVVDKVALGLVFSEYFSLHKLLHNQHLSSGAGTIGQTVAAVPGGLSLTP